MYAMIRKFAGAAARGQESRGRRPRCSRPGLEALEGRQLLSLGNEFLVNVNTNGAQFFSDNASSANGMHVAVWATNGFGDIDIHGQLYSAQGLRVGQELTIAGSGAVEQNPHVAMDSNGNFVVTFEKTVNGQRDVIAKRFNSSGTSLGEIVVANDPNRSEYDADVAMDANGNFVVAYTLDFSSTDKDVLARRYNSSGVLDPNFSPGVSTSGGEVESRPSVAMSPDGRFDIAYQTMAIAGGPTVLNLAQYKADGSLIANGGIKDSGFSFIFGSNPSIAMDNGGNAVVAFQEFNTGGTGRHSNLFDIGAIRVRSSGTFGGSFSITESGISDPPVQNVLPSVALSPTGGSFVVGFDQDYSQRGGPQTVAVVEVNATDTPVFAFVLPASPTNVAPAVSVAGNGNYLFTFDAFNSAGDRDIDGRFGQLPTAPQAQNLVLTSPITAGHSATLSGQLVEADGDTNLTLTVNWGDASKVQHIHPGTKPFKLKHKFNHPGTYTVHATWGNDSTGLSNGRDLTLVVNPRHLPAGPGAARFHRA